MVTIGRKILVLTWAIGLAALAGCRSNKASSTPPPPGLDEETVAGTGEQTDTGEENPPPPPEKLDEVQRVFRLGRMDLERCFNELVTRKQNTNLKGFLILAVKLGVSPTPAEVRIFKMSPSLEEAEFKRCVLRTVKNWTFPTWGHLFEVTSPKFTFLGT